MITKKGKQWVFTDPNKIFKITQCYWGLGRSEERRKCHSQLSVWQNNNGNFTKGNVSSNYPGGEIMAHKEGIRKMQRNNEVKTKTFRHI